MLTIKRNLHLHGSVLFEKGFTVQYDCAVSLKPLNHPDDAGTTPAVGVTEEGTDSWVWGLYPVYDSRCQDRLAHPRLQQLLETDGHTRSRTWSPFRRSPPGPS